ncbi:hypothetical protein PR048_017075 [Dryococelus australis]|uniref:Uncharacterized protein n=1 Tax=Dryococelus australis TaxID=614101 RepID=A0ABQ9H8H3_9NEOP|nr:hypothetical protein PR048_017075 [Dryococelus australis]
MGCNKQQIIKLISEEMLMRGSMVFQAEAGADVDITKSTVNSLLILLLHNTEYNGKHCSSNRIISQEAFHNLFSAVSYVYSCYFFMHSLYVITPCIFMILVKKKTVFQQLLKGDRVLHSCATGFALPGKNPADIVRLGSQAMAVIFGGKSTETSTKFHCLRVYYQTMIRMSMASKMNPANWGWKTRCR